jgi:cytidylate kinase
LSSFWQNFTRLALLTNQTLSLETQRYIPSDSELFEMECSTIQRIAEKSSAVFLGRCGYHVLQDHPRRVSILVTANLPARVKRLRELFNLPEAQALDLIQTNDRDRAAYIRTLTKQNWFDVRPYDLCLNTSAVGLDCAVELVETCVRAKLQLLAD